MFLIIGLKEIKTHIRLETLLNRILKMIFFSKFCFLKNPVIPYDLSRKIENINLTVLKR